MHKKNNSDNQLPVVIVFVLLLIGLGLNAMLPRHQSSYQPVLAATAVDTDEATVFIPPTNTATFTITLTPQQPSLVQHKYVENETDSGSTTQDDPAEGNDVLRYRLEVSNTSSQAYEGYVMRDYIGDILEYAEVISGDTGWYLDGEYINFPAFTVPAQSSVSRYFRVRVEDPLPDSADNDCVMENTFGNTVLVYLACEQDLRIKKYVSDRDSGGWKNYDDDDDVLEVDGGERIYYQIRIWNAGEEDVRDVRIEDEFENSDDDYLQEVDDFDHTIDVVDHEDNNSEDDAIEITYEAVVEDCDELDDDTTTITNKVWFRDNEDTFSRARVRISCEDHTRTPTITRTPTRTNTPTPSKTPSTTPRPTSTQHFVPNGMQVGNSGEGLVFFFALLGSMGVLFFIVRRISLR